MLRIGGCLELALLPAPQAQFPAQPLYPTYAHMNTMPLKMFLQALGAKAFSRALVGSENFRFEPGLLPRPFRGRAFAPGVIAADRNTRHSAHRWHRIVLSHLFNHAVPHRDSLAKYVANFFNRSRSIFTCASSRCTRASSASSSVSGFWSLPTFCSLPALAERTQFASVLSGTESRRAASETPTPSVNA